MAEESAEKAPRRSKLLLIGVAVAVIALVVAATVALMNRDAGGPADRGSTPTPPELKQARWHIETGVVPKGSKGKRSVLKLQAAAVASVIKQFYDAFLIHPEEFSSLQGENISPGAAQAFVGSKIASGKTIERVQTLRRAAKIGLQAPTALHASARVGIKLRGKVGSKKVRLSHHATLWLERSGGKWQVIAFEADQRPIR